MAESYNLPLQVRVLCFYHRHCLLSGSWCLDMNMHLCFSRKLVRVEDWQSSTLPILCTSSIIHKRLFRNELEVTAALILMKRFNFKYFRMRGYENKTRILLQLCFVNFTSLFTYYINDECKFQYEIKKYLRLHTIPNTHPPSLNDKYQMFKSPDISLFSCIFT